MRTLVLICSCEIHWKLMLGFSVDLSVFGNPSEEKHSIGLKFQMDYHYNGISMVFPLYNFFN
jgi:hypothetical protein